MNAVLLTPPNINLNIPMKTKLTLLLALATASALHAEKPGFNGPRVSTNPPASAPARSIPSSGGNSPSRVSAGQIIGIARTVLPLIQSMRTPRQAPPPPAKQNPPMTVKKPVVAKKPATNRSSGSSFKAPAASTIPNQAPATRHTPDARLGGLSGQQAAGIREGREIAEGLASLESLRASFSEVPGLGNVLHQPGNASRAAGNPAETFGEDSSEFDDGSADIHNPLDKNSGPGAGLTNIQRSAGRSRQATPATRDQMTPTAGRVFDSASRLTFGSGSSSTGGTPVYREDEGNGDIVVEQRGTDANGQPAAVVVIEYSGTNGQTLGTKELVYHSNEHGKQVIDVVTRDPEGNVTSSGTSEACGLDPETAASLGGPVGPTVQNVTGLTDLDLLRQFANGEAPSGGSNFMTRRTNAIQILPPSPDGTSNTRSNRGGFTIDLLQPGGRGINGIGGGDRPDSSR